LLLGVGASRAEAQTMGIRAGISSSNVTEHPEIPGDISDPITGLMAGVFFMTPIRGPLAFHVEALVSRKGNRLIDEAAGIDSVLTTDYVEVPVLASLSLLSRRGLTFRLDAGPALGVLLHRRETGFGKPLPDDAQINIKRFDLGVAIGGELERKAWTFGIRYTVGSANIFDDDPALYGIDTLLNRVFSAYGGWSFHR
jgi:hypothetical protein